MACALLLVLLASYSPALAENPSSLPVVDLGYELHRASYLNSSGSFYNFSNIRYAEPPIGDLRFRAPVPVSGTSSAINDGSVGRICPQANPTWLLIAAQFTSAYTSGQPFNLTAAEAIIAQTSGPTPAQDPRTSEDCLFLDVLVPEAIFGKSTRTVNASSSAPVLVWRYGGGYTAGEKTGFGQYNPVGLLEASRASGSEGIFFVSMNYRLGAFGWLAGPTLQSHGTANAALYDQRLALEWVQQNIHLFGGDPKRVTVIGESAGGGSIVHQITAFGGLKGPVPFQQAVLQSPGFQLMPSSYQQERVFDSFLALLNVSSLQEARKLPSSALIIANLMQVGLQSDYGFFTYGPVVDGAFTPALPGKLLLQGAFDKNVNVMVGHNADEGLLFTNPAITNESAFAGDLPISFPVISPSVQTYIEEVLYPAVYDGSYGYQDEIGRIDLVISESTFSCNTFYLDRAYNNQTYAYEFSVPPALHGQDIPYTFFNGPNAQVKSDAAAIALQEYIASFAETGVPSGPKLPHFPLYGNNSEIQDVKATSITEIMDPTANARCVWWQKGLVY